MNKLNLTKAVGAGIAGTIAMTLLMMIAPMMGLPKMSAPTMLSGFMGFPVVVGWLAHFMIGTGLALAYASVFVSNLPGSPAVRGVLFGLVPWLMLEILVYPMMGTGLFAANTPAPAMMVVGGLMGHVVYGAVVGLIYGTTAHPRPATA